MTAPIPMRPDRALTDDTLHHLAVYGLDCALDLITTRDAKWIERVITDAGIDTEAFRAAVEANVAALAAIRHPAGDMMAELRAAGLA